MKFQNIPQFITDTNYIVSVPLNHLIETLIHYEQEGLNINPDFQRAHVWSQEQQIEWIEYFLMGGASGRTLYFNCPNWPDRPDGEYREFVLVDGLQRLSAFLAFLNGEIPAFGFYIHEYEDKLLFSKANNNIRFNINALNTEKAVLQWYLQINTTGTPHTEQELEKVKAMLEELE